MGGPAVGEARRQPPAIIGSSIPGPLAGGWIQDPPGPWRILDEGQLLHHLRPSPPRPPGRRLTGNGGLYWEPSKSRHINRVGDGPRDGDGAMDGAGDGAGVGTVDGTVDGAVDGARESMLAAIRPKKRGKINIT
jgi:hypothetical protein